MPPSQDDPVAGGPGGSSRRRLIVAGGFLLAVGATLAVFLTDNPQYLRIAVVAVAWAFVLATLAAGRRGGDQVAAAAREAQLRLAYEHELDREVAARREYELELENELRRESEQVMREELDALRGELAALADLRDQVAGVAALHSDVAGLAGLREEVARVAAMREDIVALGSLRHELGQLHELRDDMGRLRAELTEQLSSEMLIERIVMRTQASRLPGEPVRLDPATRTLDAAWTEEPGRELTGSWTTTRSDEPRETRQFEQVRVERTDGRGAAPQTTGPAPHGPALHTSSSWTPPAPPTTTFAGPQPSRLGPPPSAPVPAEPPPAEPPPSPLDWLVARELLDAPLPPRAEPVVLPAEPRAEVPEPEVRVAPPAPAPRPSPRRRRSDESEPPPVPAAEALTVERPAPVQPEKPAPVQPEAPATSPAASPDTDSRLAAILAENGVSPSGGGRRRRRYREDGDDTDDVLSRVLGRG